MGEASLVAIRQVIGFQRPLFGAGGWRLTPKRQTLRAVVEAFAISRGILLAVTAVVALVREQTPIDIWNQWDTIWYLGITHHGYKWVAPGHEATHFQGASLAFFPLFPLLLRCVETVGVPALAGGLILSNAAFFGALIYTYRLIREEYGSYTSRRSLLLLALFPTAFFTFAPYSESLFLLAASGTLFHARRGQALAAGCWLAAALLTHSTGVILILPAALMLQARSARTWLSLLGPAVAGWVGCLAYFATTGIPIMWLFTAQRAWHRAIAFPWTGFVGSLQWVVHHGETQIAMVADNLFTLAVTIAFLGLTISAWRELSVPVRAYCAGFWLIILLSPQWLDAYYAPFGSVDRFVLVLFPLTGWAARRFPARRLHPVMLVSAFGMALMSALHVSGVWVG
jgi:hypothetical protein